MGKFLTFLILMVCFYILWNICWLWSVNRAKRKSLFPAKGKATLFDVRTLIIQGEKDLAIQLYCEIFRSTRRVAKKAVDELEKNIQAKNSKLE